jgi:hypothetical protein
MKYETLKSVTSSRSIAIKWTLPVTSSDFILQTEVRLYDGTNDLVFNRVVNYPVIAQIDQPHNTI